MKMPVCLQPLASIVLVSLALASASLAFAALPADRNEIRFEARAPEGLVGNGRSVVRVTPGGFVFHWGGDAKGTLRVAQDGKDVDLVAHAGSTFFPGGVVYTATAGGLTVDVLHGASAAQPYFVAVRVRGATGAVDVTLDATGEPAVAPRGPQRVALANGTGTLVFAAGSPLAPAEWPLKATSWDDLRAKLEAPYREGLVLETPDRSLDRAVAHSRALIDLGFDGKLHVCEIFRWRDVWSRDLGSGLVPGAFAGGRWAAGRTTIEYDLARHKAKPPRGLRATQDPSQGGTAEGVAWLTRAVWMDYMLTGDAAFLAHAEEILRPWFEAWIDRDPRETGLLVDVSEWMDHSRFFLFPDGARVLYSNALFAQGLGTFARIEAALGDAEHTGRAERYRALAQRFVRGVNGTLWNESKGQYDNLTLWGRHDERSAEENALAVFTGVAPPERAKRALASLRATNWRTPGSVTITPPMSHVDARNDHNYKVWPWWNALEARVRLTHDDVDGGVWLLDRCAATIEDERFPYPGMMEELLTPDGMTDGGFAFLTGAGSYLNAVVEGLLGVEVLEPAHRRLRVDPHVPAGWTTWRATVPLPDGAVVITAEGGTIRVRVTDPHVKTVEAPASVTVEGAGRADVTLPVLPGPDDLVAPTPRPVPPPRARRAATFFEPGLPSAPFAGLPEPRVGAEDLLTLDPAKVEALVVAGNALPFRTKSGADVAAALDRYLARGGALVFHGATMDERGTMGETGGVVAWYGWRATAALQPVTQWTFRVASLPTVAEPEERGLREGWAKRDLPAEGWVPMPVAVPWESVFPNLDGWGWYRAHVTLPAAAKGHAIVVSLGRVDDDEWTYLNGVAVGATRGTERVRYYRVVPGDPAYATLTFGGDNVLAVRVFDGGGDGGMKRDVPQVGYETDASSWGPIDPANGAPVAAPTRHAVISWGPGRAFFDGWEAERGAFGFAAAGRGVRWTGALAGLAPLDVDVHEAFTDFAVSAPWVFEPLAFTETRRGLLVPDGGETYPCVARVVNTQSGGEIVLIADSVARSSEGAAALGAVLAPPRPAKIVVLAPHPDDGESSCGGLVANATAAGDAVVVLSMTGGEIGVGGATPARAREIRVAEARRAAAALGARAQFFGGMDGALAFDRESTERLKDMLLRLAPTVVLAPWPLDVHADHQATGQLAWRVYQDPALSFELFFYETANPPHTRSFGFVPTDYVDITAVAERKRQATMEHRSQSPEAWFDMYTALARVHGYDADTPLAEAYVRARNASGLGGRKGRASTTLPATP